MNAAELDAMLRQFLVDNVLSETEAKVMAGWVKKYATTDQHRAAARSRVFNSARQLMADGQSQQILDFVQEALRAIDKPQANAIAIAPDELFVSPGDACLGRVIARLTNCRRTADICVFTITDDRISRAILEAHRRSVKVRIITDNDKAFDAGSDVERFRQAGIPLLVDMTPYHMHHKFAIFDGARVLNGSYNWTRGAAEFNEENIVDTGEPTIIAAFQAEFDKLWTMLNR